jgi:hypothetical protein
MNTTFHHTPSVKCNSHSPIRQGEEAVFKSLPIQSLETLPVRVPIFLAQKQPHHGIARRTPN